MISSVSALYIFEAKLFKIIEFSWWVSLFFRVKCLSLGTEDSGQDEWRKWEKDLAYWKSILSSFCGHEASFLFFCCFSLSSKHKNIFGLFYILGPLFQKFLLLFFFSETFLFLWGKKGREKSHQNVLMTIKSWLSSKELFLTKCMYAHL